MTRREPEMEIEYTEEQKADIEQKILAAQEERDYTNACDRRYRNMMLQINQERNQNIEGITITDKFEVEAWQKEWNEFRVRHGLPVLNFEEMRERARKAQR
jgi:hypothetical protein